jgi:hypothetical protein
MKPKMRDFTLYITVVAGFSLRFSTSDGIVKILRKLLNPSIRSGQALKVADTRPNVPFGTGPGINRSI